MRSIEAIKEMNKENLYSFYTGIGNNAGFTEGKIATARYISNPGMEWPSYILGGGKMTRTSLLDIFAQMRNGNLPFFWLRLLEEDPEFEDFAAEHGVRKINFWRGMYLHKSKPFSIPPPQPRIIFEELRTQQDLKDWLQVVNMEIMTHRELGIRNFLGILNDPGFRFYRISNGKKTISTILLHKRKSETGIYMVSTLLSERGKGFGRWITASAIDRLISEGFTDFVLHATPLGYPVYQKLGFEECCDYGIFWMLGRK